MTDTPNLGLPQMAAGQVQKHVVLNESLRILDVLCSQPTIIVLDNDLATPPGSPADGALYLLPASSTGAWATHDGDIAYWDVDVWTFFDPEEGWMAYSLDANASFIYNGTAWVSFTTFITGAITELQNLTKLGVNATADTTNKLSVASAAILLNHIGNGIQVKLNKAANIDTASFLFQTAFSGRAEMGTLGSDDFGFKVSPDGAVWFTGFTIDRATGKPTFAQIALTQDGAVATPGVAFAADPNTGLYRIGADTLGLAAGGVEALRATATGVNFTADSTTVASAATTDLNSATTLKVSISGSVTVTSFGTTPYLVKLCRLTGAPLLTHNATTLILPGAANIQGAAGDTFIATSDSSGNVTVRAYIKANGKAIIGPASTDITDSTTQGRLVLVAATLLAQIQAQGFAGTVSKHTALDEPIPLPTLDLQAYPEMFFFQGFDYLCSTTSTRINQHGLLEIVPINTPRHAYHPTTLQYLGILLERNNGGTVNQCLQSEDLTTTWTAIGSSTISGTAYVDGFGNNNTKSGIVESTNNEEHGRYQDVTATVNNRKNFSCFAKKGSRNYLYMKVADQASPTTNYFWAMFDLNAGTVFASGVVGNASAVAAKITYQTATGLYICEVSGIANTSGTVVRMSLQPSSDGSAVSYTGSSAATAIVCMHMQFETANSTNLLSVTTATSRTSYKPTTTVAVTCADNDPGEMALDNGIYNNARSTVFIEWTPTWLDTDQTVFCLDDGNTTQAEQVDARGASGNFNLRVRSGGANIMTDQSQAITLGDFIRSAVAWRANRQRVAHNGVMTTGATSATQPATFTRLRIGIRGSTTTQSFFGYISRIALWATDLTDAMMQVLTTAPQDKTIPGGSDAILRNLRNNQRAPVVLYTQNGAQLAVTGSTPITMIPSGRGVLSQPPSWWKLGKVVEVEAGGIYSTPVTPGTLTLTIKLNAVTIATVAASAVLVGSATASLWTLKFRIRCATVGASGTVYIDGLGLFEGAAGALGPAKLDNAGASVTIDTTIWQTLSMVASWDDGNASKILKVNDFTVRSLN